MSGGAGAVVLDASAVLALLHEEPGADVVADALARALVSAVNLSECVAQLVAAGVRDADARAALELLGLTVVPFDAEQAWDAGCLRTATRRLGLSLGDRACLALARLRGLPVLTADRAWVRLDVGVEVRPIR